MGNGPSSTATSTSSSYVNGVEMTITDSSSCAWYFPLCSGASAKTSTNMIVPNQMIFVIAAATALILIYYILLMIRISSKQSARNQAYRSTEFLGHERSCKYYLETDIPMRTFKEEVSAPLIVGDTSRFQDVALAV